MKYTYSHKVYKIKPYIEYTHSYKVYKIESHIKYTHKCAGNI